MVFTEQDLKLPIKTQFMVQCGWETEYKVKRFKLSGNILYTGFNAPLMRDKAFLYRKFLFNGTSLVNASVDYSWRYRNYTFFGELAASDNSGTAQIHGLLLGLDRKVDMSLVYRKYDSDYQVLNPNAFASE